jgi:hypothetical protein
MPVTSILEGFRQLGDGGLDNLRFYDAEVVGVFGPSGLGCAKRLSKPAIRERSRPAGHRSWLNHPVLGPF